MIVLARKVQEQEFVEMTGKYNDTPLFRDIWKAESLVYSSDDAELNKAKDFAKTEGYNVFVLADTPDVLNVARQMILDDKNINSIPTAITETREAWIPTSMLSDFKARVIDLNKRAAKFKCDPLTYNITDEKDTIRIPAEQMGGYVKPGYSYDVTKVEITGTTPIIPGYQVVAKIDHDSEVNTNIIMEFGGFKLPAEYLHKDCNCDHCNIKRQRNKTYILRADDTEKLSQVGSSCLKDFTGHSNPENVCKIQEFMDDSMGELSEFGGSSHSSYIKVEPFLDIIAQCTLQYGYVSAKKAEEKCVMSTADEAMEVYKNDAVISGQFKITDEAKELSSKAVAFIKSLDRDKYDNYANNIISFVDNGMVKTKYYRMLASSIVFYNNEQFKLNKHEDNKHKTFIGEIDTKITFNAKLIGQSTSQNDFGIVHINRFNDDNGNNITWFTNSAPSLTQDLDYRVTATIKSHKMYNDEPQTIITRPKFEFIINITDDEVQKMKTLSDRIGDFKGNEAITAYSKFHEETYKAEPQTNEAYQYGIGNIAVYLGDLQANDKIKKTLVELNMHQTLLLAAQIQKSGFAAVNSPDQTKKFFKINDAAVTQIKELYPTIKAAKSKSR